MSAIAHKSSVLFKSSIGKKFIMGLTGLFLISFLLVHCFINSMIFFDSTGALFNDWAHFMGTNIFIRTAEFGLFAGLLLHIIDGLMLYFQNRGARPQKYAYTNQAANSQWYSRSMAILGTLLLIFLIIHLGDFWVKSRFTGLPESSIPGVHDLYKVMFEEFGSIVVVIIYVATQFSLGYHLLHGFESAFQTLGLNHTKYNRLIHFSGMAFSIVIPFLFALMPIVIYLRH